MDAQDTRTAGETALRRRGEAWVEWMRSNLSRGCRRADLVREMLRAGWSAQEAELALETMAHRLGRGAQTQPGRPDVRPGDANYLECDGRRIRIAMSLVSPRIVLLEGLLSDEECDALEALVAARGLQPSAVVDHASGASVAHHARSSAGVAFAHAEDGLVARMESRLATLTGWPASHAEGVQILRYAPGQEYRPHFDWFDPEHPGSATHLAEGGQRVATTVIYLATPEAGGRTIFPSLGLEFSPARGAAIFFTDVDGDGRPERGTLHGGSPVVSGVKLIATYWQRAAPFLARRP